MNWQARCGFEEVAALAAAWRVAEPLGLGRVSKRIAAARQIPQPLRTLLQSVPASANFMDVLRSGVSVLAHFDPDAQDSSRAANLRKAERLLGQIPIVIAERYRILKNLPPPAPRADLGHAANFLLHAPRPGGGTAGGQGFRRLADSLRRARVQRLDLHGPRRLFDRIGPALERRGGDRRRSRAGCTEAPTNR